MALSDAVGGRKASALALPAAGLRAGDERLGDRARRLRIDDASRCPIHGQKHDVPGRLELRRVVSIAVRLSM